MYNKSTIDNIIQEGYKFELGDYISKGWDLFKDNVGPLMLAGLLYLLVSCILAITIVGIIVIPALSFGFYKMAMKLDKGEPISPGDIFSGFDHVGPLVKLVLRQILYLLPLILIMYGILGFMFYSAFEGGGGIEDLNSGAINLVSIVLSLPMYYFYAIWLYAPFLTVFYGYSSAEALRKSREIVQPHIWMVIVFVFVANLIAGLGIYACCIGVLASMPLSFLMKYSAFKDVILSKEESYHDGNALQNSFIGNEE